jgi:hypothetical protein
LLFIIEFSRLSINPVSWSKPSFVGFNKPTASDGLFLSIILALLTLSPNDMESIINSANQYARDIERIDADSNTDSTDTSGLDDLSFLKCDDKTKSLTTASALPSLINSI